MSEEPVARDEVLGALEHTVASGAARVEFRYEFDFDPHRADSRTRPARLGPLVRRLTQSPGRQSVKALVRAARRALVGWVVSLAVSVILRVVKRWLSRWAAQRAVGVIDFDAHRCIYGSPARSEVTLVEGDEYREGAPGTAVDSLSKRSASWIQPLWLLDLIRGLQEAQASGEEVLDGHTCRRFVGHADLQRAADGVPYDIAVPLGLEQLGQLKEIPVELWIDRQRHIRRIRYKPWERRGAPNNTTTLDLSEFGVVKPPPDWSRLELPA
ncbi:MAG: hypothetical protein M3131_02420 [Actinomycetota bacterium]|nr:hypothetical protein [Actinomycetota bacterium]